jgi:hypothetical protein
VNTYRNGQFGSQPIPTWLAQLFGTAVQPTRALAIAQTAPATGAIHRPECGRREHSDHDNGPIWVRRQQVIDAAIGWPDAGKAATST